MSSSTCSRWSHRFLDGLIKYIGFRGFPGSPVVRTGHFHCQGLGFDPWLGN